MANSNFALNGMKSSFNESDSGSIHFEVKLVYKHNGNLSSCILIDYKELNRFCTWVESNLIFNVILIISKKLSVRSAHYALQITTLCEKQI